MGFDFLVYFIHSSHVFISLFLWYHFQDVWCVIYIYGVCVLYGESLSLLFSVLLGTRSKLPELKFQFLRGIWKTPTLYNFLERVWITTKSMVKTGEKEQYACMMGATIIPLRR